MQDEYSESSNVQSIIILDKAQVYEPNATFHVGICSRLEKPISTAPEVGLAQRYSPTATNMLDAEHDADDDNQISGLVNRQLRVKQRDMRLHLRHASAGAALNCSQVYIVEIEGCKAEMAGVRL